MTRYVLLLLCVSLVTACRSTPQATPAEPLIVAPHAVDDAMPVPQSTEPALVASSQVIASALPMQALVAGSASERAAFGDGELGYVLWASGGLAAWMRFEDSNADGVVEPKFGQHGAALQDGPVPYVVDLQTGEATRVAQVLSWDASSRYLVVRPHEESSQLKVWDTQTMQSIDVDESSWGVSLSPDRNACLTPRQARVTSSGMIWTIAQDEQSVVGRPFAGGDPLRIEVGARVWRIEPVDAQWISIMYVPKDTDKDGALTLPVQNTSCACLFCSRFARSMGQYGWRGDAWALKLAAPNGELSPATQGFLIPLTEQVYASAQSEGMRMWPSGEPLTHEPPKSCVRAPWLSGVAPKVLMTCEQGESVLWDPATGESSPLKSAIVSHIEQEVTVSEAGTHWFSAVVQTEQGVQLARIRIEDGLIEVGARSYATPLRLTHAPSGLTTAYAQGHVEALELGSGRRWSGDIDAATTHVSFTPQGVMMEHVMDDSSRAMHPLSQGCVLSAAGEQDRIEQGPWRVTCASKDLEVEENTP